ncbi:MAG: Fe3+/spermidine/putrescine ABC transporter ATP-binding protein [Actinobacteria bacterium BACL15 MAG-120823-bin78]|uniref:ABC-type quaternary amine transporter n=1 Tax=Actinobacteria bacterium BACL15 MAG-120823-bin78 TaxID=1655563 RepID=A0A0R2PEH7_9ACTN|nr:MAG: Fe3+/spermidine/putrescine ABC transporter ATP-binding protein [Actinobacteria bacterium BACL15 MAG-120823-bin78]
MILDDLSFSLAEGQIAALLGPSGCGKTTLLRSIAGLIQPSDGTIRFGKQLVSLSSLVMPSHKRKIGYVPQEGALFPHLSVADNIAFGLDRSVFTKDQIRQTTKEMLNLIGLQGYESRMPNQLSGGQQTRVALARALAIKPAIVLLDEPFSALDEALRDDLRSDVINLLRASKTTAILVTHDREEALVSADVVALMRAGKIVQQGSPEAVYSKPISPAIAVSTGDALVLDAQRLADGSTSYLFNPAAVGASSESGQIVIRPEEITIDRALSATSPKGRISKIDYYGHDAMVTVEVAGQSIKVRIPGPFDFLVGEEVGVHHTGPVRFFAQAEN